MTIRKMLFILALAVIWAVPVATYAADHNTSYVSTTDLPPTLLPLPYPESSDAWKKDISIMTTVQKNITDADMTALRDEQHLRIEVVTEVMGSNFTREKKPATFALLDRVYGDIGAITEVDKQFWHTKRPYLEDKQVKLLVDPVDQSPSYPSGHTAASRVLAEVLGLLYPNQLEILRARADAIAWHRVEAGVHYPHDLEGGRTLAMLMMGALMKSQAFQNDLTAARKEVSP